MPETLASRERILKALNHEEPDKAPMDRGGTYDSSIAVEGYERLKAYFRVVIPHDTGPVPDGSLSLGVSRGLSRCALYS